MRTGDIRLRNRTCFPAVTLGAFVMLASLQGCTDPVGYSTPEELFQAEYNATGTGDVGKLSGCVPPSHRGPYRRMLVLAGQYSEQVTATGNHIKDNFGENVRAAFVSKYDRLVWQSPFARFTKDGRIDWRIVTIDQKGNRALAQVPGDGIAYAIRLPDGKWYRVFSDTGDADDSLKVISYGEALLRDGLRDIDEIRQKVERGFYTEDQLLELLGQESK